MTGQVATRSTPTAKPVIAGIFDIVIGAGILIGVSVVSIAGLVIGAFTFPFIGLIIPLLGIPATAVGVLAVVGGTFAVQRRKWGWALAGSIAAAIVSNALGVAAIILIAISRDEFENEGRKQGS